MASRQTGLVEAWLLTAQLDGATVFEAVALEGGEARAGAAVGAAVGRELWLGLSDGLVSVAM